MKKRIFLIIAALALLQVTVVNYLKVFSIKPDLILIGVVIASLYLDLNLALSAAIFSGILKDAFLANTFGINTLLYPLWGLLIIKLSRKITIDNNVIRAVLIFIVLIFNAAVTRLIFLSLGRTISAGIFLRLTFLESLYTALILPLVFRAVDVLVNNS